MVVVSFAFPSVEGVEEFLKSGFVFDESANELVDIV
jgi:hypothetical protein